MRLFIALNLTAPQKDRIYQAAESLREDGLPVRWTEKDRLHITLKFLGDLPKARVADVEKVMARIAGETPAFEMDLGGFGAFPTIRRPEVLWLGVDPSPILRCLKQDLEWALSDLGFPAETRAFHPHVTLGRAQEKGGAGDFRGLDDKVAAMDFSDRIPVRTVDLMRSRLSRGGAQHSLISRAQLAKA